MEESTSSTLKMKLHSRNFAAVSDGTKIAELRLYDKKRQSLNLQSSIIFSDSSDENLKPVKVNVRGLLYFPSFRDVFSFIPGKWLGKSPRLKFMDENSCPDNANGYKKWYKKVDSLELHIKNAVLDELRGIYTPEQEKENGVIVIVLEREKF